MNARLKPSCNPSRLHSFLNSEAVSDRKKLLEKTPFKGLLLLPDVSINTSLLIALLDRWDDEKKGFSLGEKLVRFSSLDVALIFGLPTSDGLKTIDLANKSGNYCKEFTLEVLPKKPEGVKCKELDQIEDAIEKMDISIKEGERTCSILLVLHLFTTFLFPTKDGKVKRSLIPHVNDLENLDQYAWGSAVLTFLNSSLSDAKSTWPGNAVYLGGCTYGLQVWAYEHITFEVMFRNFYGRTFTGAVKMTTECFPRIISWKKDQMRSYKEIFEKLTSNSVALKLSVSDIEKEKDVVKNASKDKEDQEATVRELTLSVEVLKVDMEKLLNLHKEESEVNNQLKEEIEVLKADKEKHKAEIEKQLSFHKDEVEDLKVKYQRFMEESEDKYQRLKEEFEALKVNISNSSTAGPSCHETEVPVNVQEPGRERRHVRFLNDVQLRLVYEESETYYEVRAPQDEIHAILEEDRAAPNQPHPCDEVRTPEDEIHAILEEDRAAPNQPHPCDEVRAPEDEIHAILEEDRAPSNRPHPYSLRSDKKV